MNGAQPTAIRRKIEAWLAETAPPPASADDAPRALALRTRPEWDGDPRLVVADTTVRVVPCATPLAVRAALYERGDDEHLVLLTDLTDTQLGDSLLAHLSRHTVRSIDPWDLVRQVFGGAHLDPGLVRGGRWAADALTEYAPPGGWPAPAGTLLTRDHALRCLTGHLLGLDRDQIDSAGLLQWSTRARDLLDFTRLPDPLVDGVARFLTETAGPAAAPIMTAVRAGHGADAIPLGLLAGVLWPASGGTPGTDVAVRRARLEPHIGRPTDTEAAAFRDAAEAWLYRAADSGSGSGSGSGERAEVERMLRRAETIAADITMTHLLGASAVLPSGYAQRMREFAAALRDAVPGDGAASPDAVHRAQDALDRVEEHRTARATPTETARTDTAWMAVRLLRWLARPDEPAAGTLHDALHRQVRDDAWADRARLDLFAGATDPEVAEAYRLLHRAVDARRAGHDERFAALLAEDTRADAAPGAMLRVEDVLDRVVAPVLDRGNRVLLLVLDGMSTAAAAELAESLLRPGSAWRELTPDGGHRTGALAALPTVTEVSRYSLLTGAIGSGKQADERRAFRARYPDGVLLHKGDLRSAAGAALDQDIVSALDDQGVPLVAAVVNTIDDALDRSEPGTAVWGLDTVPAVRDLLALAQDRVVVVTSDHGHVVDRETESVQAAGQGGGNRWRPATTPPGDGEVQVAGRRVGAGGGRAVLPWREELRYGPRKAGYHGGASPAEAVVPLLVLSTGDSGVPPGWAEAPVPSPAWWREPLAAGRSDADRSAAGQPDTAGRPGAPARPSRRAPRRPAQDETLFEVPAAPPPPAFAPPAPVPEEATPGRPALVDALLASDVYRQRRGTRAPLPDDRVAALVAALLAGGGRATLDTLAARADIPAHRIAGTVTALRRLLQVEGYPVLDLDADRRTVILNESLLVEQFQLGQS